MASKQQYHVLPDVNILVPFACALPCGDVTDETVLNAQNRTDVGETKLMRTLIAGALAGTITLVTSEKVLDTLEVVLTRTTDAQPEPLMTKAQAKEVVFYLSRIAKACDGYVEERERLGFQGRAERVYPGDREDTTVLATGLAHAFTVGGPVVLVTRDAQFMAAVKDTSVVACWPDQANRGLRAA
jgi:hypothetical protein